MKKLLIPFLSIPILFLIFGIKANANILPFNYVIIEYEDVNYLDYFEVNNSNILRQVNNDHILFMFTLDEEVEKYISLDDVQSIVNADTLYNFDLLATDYNLVLQLYGEIELTNIPNLTTNLPNKTHAYYAYNYNSEGRINHIVALPKYFVNYAFEYVSGYTSTDFQSIPTNDIMYDEYKKFLYNSYFESAFMSTFDYKFNLNHNFINTELNTNYVKTTYLQLDYGLNTMTRYNPYIPAGESNYRYIFNLTTTTIDSTIIYDDELKLYYNIGDITLEFPKVNFSQIFNTTGWTYDEDYYNIDNPDQKQIIMSVNETDFTFSNSLNNLSERQLVADTIFNLESKQFYMVYNSSENPYNIGYNKGYDTGYNKGFSNALIIGSESSYNRGYNEGKLKGHSEGYQEGLVADNNTKYQEGYNAGSSESFLANFDKWIVPAIIITMFVGGFFAITRHKREGDI